MMRRARWILFGAAVIAQVAVPVCMILGSEDVLSAGAAYRFQTEPVDPEDAFRGKYVALGFAADSCVADSLQRFRPHQKVYAVLGTDDAGLARVQRLSRMRPGRVDCVKVTVTWMAGRAVHFRYPFDKFFLREDEAADAERLYRKANRPGKQDSYAVVRVKNGAAVIEDLVIGGLPVREALRKGRAGE